MFKWNNTFVRQLFFNESYLLKTIRIIRKQDIVFSIGTYKLLIVGN